jgi:hypothetical protein
MVYFGLDDKGTLSMLTSPNDNGYTGPLKFTGDSSQTGPFSILVTDSQGRSLDDSISKTHSFLPNLDQSHVMGLKANPGTLWNIKGNGIQGLISRDPAPGHDSKCQ